MENCRCAPMVQTVCLRCWYPVKQHYFLQSYPERVLIWIRNWVQMQKTNLTVGCILVNPTLSNVSRIWCVLFSLYYTCIQKVKYLSGHKMIADKIQSDAFLRCQADNPLFLDATTTVTNPTFTGEWAALPLISWNLSYISQHVSVMQDHLINWKAFKIDYHKSWVLFMNVFFFLYYAPNNTFIIKIKLVYNTDNLQISFFSVVC